MQPVTFTPAASASVDRVPALERGEQRGVRVDDPVGEGVVDRLLEDRAEARHRDEVDVVRASASTTSWVYATRSKSRRSSCARRARPGRRGCGDVDGAARTVGDHHDDRQVGGPASACRIVPASRRQHPDPPHRCNVAEPSRRIGPCGATRGSLHWVHQIVICCYRPRPSVANCCVARRTDDAKFEEPDTG